MSRKFQYVLHFNPDRVFTDNSGNIFVPMNCTEPLDELLLSKYKIQPIYEWEDKLFSGDVRPLTKK